MEKPDVTALAQKMIEAVKAHVSRAVGAVVTRLDELEQRLEGLPAPEKGDQGPPGNDGHSVNVEDVLPALETKLLAELVAAIPVPKDGEPGKNGDPGESIKGDPGEPGKDGKDGASIHPDTIALMVRDAVEKSVSAAVAALPRAKDGAPGRDAAQIVPLLSIDESRSYPVGQYALHNGGELVAVRQTDPIKDGNIFEAGWAVARDGVAGAVALLGDDHRTIKIALQLTSGATAVTEEKIPVQINRGVYKADVQYEQGDISTYDGSQWCAQRTTKDKPGESSAWLLVVKRGRDGKDADSGVRKPEPVVRVK